MKITKQFAERFADSWINAWNHQEIESIMNHYDDDVVFSSPFILKSQIGSKGMLHGKSELEKYFEIALEKNPNLYFELKQIMVGIKSITLIYNRNRTMLASEAMKFNEDGKVVEGYSHYTIDNVFDLL